MDTNESTPGAGGDAAAGVGGPSGGERLRAWRRRAGLTMEEVADALDVALASVGHWETARDGRQPSFGLALLIEDISGGAVPVDAWRFDDRMVAAFLRAAARRAAGGASAPPRAA